MLFMHSLRELIQAPAVVQAVLVVAETWRTLVEDAMRQVDLPVVCNLASAGPHRTASAWHALRCLAALPPPRRPQAGDLVAIHDAARPFASRFLLARLAQAAAAHGAAVPGVPVADTIVALVADPEAGKPDGGGGTGEAGSGSDDVAAPRPAGSSSRPGAEAAAEKFPAQAVVASYLQRQRLMAVQTPQVARWQELQAAHAWAASCGASFTDDGSLLAARGLVPVVVMGEAGNWKVTTEEDWQRAAALLRRA